MHGKVCRRKKGCYGELEIEIKLDCSMITGFLGIFQQKQCLVIQPILMIPQFLLLLIRIRGSRISS